MYILYIAPSTYIDGEGGDSTHLREVVTNLSRKHKVILVARSFKKSCIKSFEFKRVRSVSSLRLDIISSSIHAFLIGLKVVRTSKIHVIFERNHTFGVGVFLGKLMRIPSVVEINGITSEEAKLANYYGTVTQKVVESLEKIVFFNATKIITVTQNIKHILHEEDNIPLKKIEVIENGANIKLFKPMSTVKSRNTLGISLDNKYVCFAGNLAPWQGVEYLIQAAPNILKTCPDARFLIIGDGPMKNEWVQFTQKLEVSDNFIFTGSIPYEQVPLYINTSDVCVAPFILARNDKIGLSPLKMYEYMACGKPIVASSIPGVSDLLKKSGSGIATTPESPDELANAVIKLLQDEDLRFQMGTNGREYVVENHSWASVAEKVAHTCENAIADYDRNK